MLWFCLFFLEGKDVVKNLELLKIFKEVMDNSNLSFFNKVLLPLINGLFNEVNFFIAFIMFLVSIISTFILCFILRKQMNKTVCVGEVRKVKVFRFKPHDNEFLIKCSGLITIITVLYTASSELAIFSTLMLSLYSPIWAYNSLIQIKGFIFLKVEVELDPDYPQKDELLIITTKKTINNFTYNPLKPQIMSIMLYNKISLIR